MLLTNNLINWYYPEDWELIFHAPFSSNFNDVVNNVSGSIDNSSYCNPTGYRPTISDNWAVYSTDSTRYRCLVYFDMSSASNYLSKIQNSNKLKLEFTVNLSYVSKNNSSDNYCSPFWFGRTRSYNLPVSVVDLADILGPDSSDTGDSAESCRVYYNTDQTFTFIWDFVNQTMTRTNSYNNISYTYSFTKDKSVVAFQYIMLFYKQWGGPQSIKGKFKDFKLFVQ